MTAYMKCRKRVVVTFPELKGCITCGNSIEEAIANAEDAKREWITACLEDGIEILSKYA